MLTVLTGPIAFVHCKCCCVVAVLNQPPIGNDRVSRTLVDQMHAQLNALLPVDNM